MLFIQKYKRYNFSIQPAAEQVIDVVFEAPADSESMTLTNLLDAAYEEQASPFFSNSNFAVKGWSGWSSVLTEGDLRRIDDPLDNVNETEFDTSPQGQIPKIGEIAEFTLDNKLSGRVEGYYKRHVKVYDVNNAHSRISKNVSDKMRAQRIAENSNAIYDINVISCTRDDAEFVSTGYYILPIENVLSKGNVAWDKRTLLQHRNDYKRDLTSHLKDSITNINTKGFPRWEAIIKKETQSLAN
jgi:hypothetical protein